jgi:hypothetical protein
MAVVWSPEQEWLLQVSKIYSIIRWILRLQKMIVVAVNILAAAELDRVTRSTRPTITGLNVLPSSEYRSGSDLDSLV